MRPFELSLSSMLLRYFLMMAVIIVAGFIGQWWLAIVALPLFLMALMGVGLGNKKEEKEAKMRTLDSSLGEELNKKVS